MPPRNLRKKPTSLEPDDGTGDTEEVSVQSIEDTRLLQKLRQRHSGVEAGTLLQRRGSDDEESPSLASAGQQDDDSGLQAVFKRERQLDEGAADPHMKQYVEAQLAATLGRQTSDRKEKPKPKTLEEEVFADSKYQRKDDLELGPSWVAGITEVPLSLEQRLKNIEDTEAAKKEMLAKSGMARPEFEDDENERTGPGSGLRRGQYPIYFGKQDPAMLKRVEEARLAKKRKQIYYAEIRAKKKQEDRPSW